MIYDVICLGDALIDFFAVESGVELKKVLEFRRIAGGTVLNVTIGCSRLGLKSAFIGKVGDDEFGYYLRDILNENNVDISQVQFDSDHRTGLAFISIPTPTTREFLFYRNPSADMLLDSSKFDEDFIKNTRIFHFGPLTLNYEPSRSATYKAIKIVKNQENIIITYDPSLRLSLWPDEETARKELFKPIKFVDLIKLNDDELFFLTKENDLKKGAKKILAVGPVLCIVSLGSKGCFYCTEKSSGFLETFDVNTVDSTGCGDSFMAAILKGIIEKSLKKLLDKENELINLLRYANAAASITSSKKGVVSALPYKKEVDEFILKNTKASR